MQSGKRLRVRETGAEIEDELVPLEEEFTPYRKENKLWEKVINSTRYEISGDEIYRTRMVGDRVSEAEIFYRY